MITRSLLTVALASAMLLAPRATRAEVAGAGDFIATFTGSTTSGAISGTVDFAPANPDFVVAGEPVDLGGDFPNGGTTIGTMLGGLFSYDLEASSSSGAFLTIVSIDGEFQSCASAGCPPPDLTLVGYPAFMNWSEGVLPNANRLYVVDATVPFEPSGGAVDGVFAINAFPFYVTSTAGAFIDTGVDVFFDSVKARVVPYQATVQYDGFPEFGTTNIVPVSAANGALPPDVVLNESGVESVFVDVQRLTPVFARTAVDAEPSATVCLMVNPDGDPPTVPLEQLRLLRSSTDGAFIDTGAVATLDPTRLCTTVASLATFVIGSVGTPDTTTTTSVPETTTTSSTIATTTTSSTSTTETTTSTSSTSSSTSTVVTTVTVTTETTTSTSSSSTTSSTSSTTSSSSTTSTSSTTATSSTSTSTSTSSSTSSTVPGCADSPTFPSILCRLDVLTATTEAGAIDARVKQNLLDRLAKARAVVLEAEERADAGVDRGAMSKLKSAERRVRGYVQRVSSLAGRRSMEAGLGAILTDHAEAIEADMKTLRQSF